MRNWIAPLRWLIFGLLIAGLWACEVPEPNGLPLPEADTAGLDDGGRAAVPPSAKTLAAWLDRCEDADGDRAPSCEGPNGEPPDCDDSHPRISPYAEADCCDGLDNDCDGETDEHLPGCPTSTDPTPWARPWEHTQCGGAWFPPQPWPEGCEDQDGDGWPACEEVQDWPDDCDDANERIAYGMPERCDGVDQDCDGLVDEDLAGCATSERPAREAEVAEPDPEAQQELQERRERAEQEGREAVFPPFPWPEGCVDEDGDGWPVCERAWEWADDCDDRCRECHPGAPSRCDGRDNDCDGETDAQCGPE